MKRVLAILALCLALPLSSQAQFGPPEPTPRNAKEIYADRAITTAFGFLETRQGDVVSSDDIDPERAAFWFQEAVDAYTELCEARDNPRDQWARNCYKLGGMYLRGEGIAQSYSQAEDLFLEACRAGQNTEACLQQAYTDHTGNAGETNWNQARELYDIACTRGDQAGCAGLGNMLYRAQGGPPDRPRAARLLMDACADDYQWACDRLTGFGLPQRPVR